VSTVQKFALTLVLLVTGLKSLCIVLLITLSTSCLHAQNAGSALKDQLVAQVDAFMHAWEKHDTAALEATMAPEFWYVSSRGVAPKEDVVGALTNACTLTSYSLSDVRVMPISPDSAALVYKIHQSVSCAGHPDPPVVLNTDTLVRRDGKWLFLLTTSTPAE
jgi:hypothetical protein